MKIQWYRIGHCRIYNKGEMKIAWADKTESIWKVIQGSYSEIGVVFSI